MRVLIVHPSKGFYGGAEVIVSKFSSYLIDKGHDVTLVAKDAPREWLAYSFALHAKDWWELRKMVRVMEQDTDVINVHNFPATLMCFPTKKPIVWMCNEPPELFTNWKRSSIEAFNRWWVRKSKMKVVVADEVQAFRFQGIYGVSPEIIPYGIDYNFWSRGRRNKKKEGKIRLLQVGTITPYKNQLASIKVVENLLGGKLTLAGKVVDKDYYRSLINYIDSRELGDLVDFVGQRTQEEIRILYSEQDVLIHPVKEQGGWLVPFEAVCAGLPVVVSPSFTASSIIEKNKLGVVTDDLVCGIKRVVEEDFSHAEEWIRDNLTWEKFGERMLEVFERKYNELEENT